MTLNHLLEDVTKNRTKMTSFTYSKTFCNTAYHNEEKRLLLLLLPDNCAKSEEMEKITSELIRMFKFIYNTLEDCFKTENFLHVDHILTMFFVRMLNGGFFPNELKVPENVENIPVAEYFFEDILPAVHSVDLPNEVIVQVEDALTELEACDYREWVSEFFLNFDIYQIFFLLE